MRIHFGVENAGTADCGNHDRWSLNRRWRIPMIGCQFLTRDHGLRDRQLTDRFGE